MWNILQLELKRLWWVCRPGWIGVPIALVLLAYAQEPAGLRSFGFQLSPQALESGITGLYLLFTCLAASPADPGSLAAIARAQPHPSRLVAAEWLAIWLYCTAGHATLLGLGAAFESTRQSHAFSLASTATLALNGTVVTSFLPMSRRLLSVTDLQPALALLLGLTYFSLLAPAIPAEPSTGGSPALQWNELASGPCLMVAGFLLAGLREHRQRRPS